MAETVIQGAPIDPVEEFRSWPPPKWQLLEEFSDIIYEVAEGIARITINRPRVRNAFRPQTLFELSRAFELARDNVTVASTSSTSRYRFAGSRSQ
jgi:1,4-dihydroxy-2-naphthoyl-CoA synthase